MGSKFYTKLSIKGDNEDIIVMHCGLVLLEVLNMLFTVCLIFDCRGKWSFSFAISGGSKNMCFLYF